MFAHTIIKVTFIYPFSDRRAVDLLRTHRAGRCFPMSGVFLPARGHKHARRADWCLARHSLPHVSRHV